jgi:hypothetical protein
MSTESEIRVFLGEYMPKIAAQVQDARRRLAKLFPRGFELVYDNYNALGFGFSSTERASGVVISVVAYPRWVTLFFLKGAALSDPKGLLQGTGSTVRSVRLSPPEVLTSRPVAALIKDALRPYATAFAQAPPLSTVIKSVSARKRPRRPN